jgi:amino acid transporter
MAIAMITPLTTFSTNLADSLILGIGNGTILVTLLVVVLLALFTAGYLVMNRHVLEPAAYAAYTGYGLGRRLGSGVLVMSVLGYTFATAAFVGLGGFFLAKALAPTGLGGPWWLYSCVYIAVIAVTSIRGVDVTARFNTLICGLQFAMLAALFVAVIVQTPEQFEWRVFSPAQLQGPGLGLSIVFVLLSLAGFESSAAYGEEARNPHRTIARATYLTLWLLGALFVVGTWVVIAASANDTVQMSGADPGDLMTNIYTRYLGSWTGTAVSILVAITILGAALAFHNLAIRYLFSAGRSGFWPAALSHTHPTRRSPHIAVIVQLIVTVLLLLPFVVTGRSPLIDLLPAIGGYNALNMIVKMSLVSISVIVAKKAGTVSGSMYATLIAPVLATLGFMVAGYFILSNYHDVTGTDATWVNWMPAVMVAGVIYGWVRQGQVDKRNAHLLEHPSLQPAPLNRSGTTPH